MNERDPRARPPQIERCLGRRIAATDYDRILKKRLVPFTVQMGYVLQIFAWDVQPLGRPEITRRDHHRPRLRPALFPRLSSRHHDKVSSLAFDGGNSLTLTNWYSEMQHCGAIVAEPISAIWLLRGDHEWQSANSQLLGSRKEPYVCRVRGDRAHHYSSIQHQRPEPRILRRDRGRQTARSGANDQDVRMIRHR